MKAAGEDCQISGDDEQISGNEPSIRLQAGPSRSDAAGRRRLRRGT